LKLFRGDDEEGETASLTRLWRDRIDEKKENLT
jgi:hypothetical protein